MPFASSAGAGTMEIGDYTFGRIDIGDTSYTSDVIITPDRVIDHWWRKEGHSLAPEDLAAVVASRPEAVVVGTGYYGRMQVPEATRTWLESMGIRVYEARTAEAVAEFNRLQRECADIVAALHLTC